MNRRTTLQKESTSDGRHRLCSERRRCIGETNSRWRYACAPLCLLVSHPGVVYSLRPLPSVGMEGFAVALTTCICPSTDPLSSLSRDCDKKKKKQAQAAVSNCCRPAARPLSFAPSMQSMQCVCARVCVHMYAAVQHSTARLKEDGTQVASEPCPFAMAAE